MTKVEFYRKVEQFDYARKWSNFFGVLFISVILLGTGALVMFDPNIIWTAITLVVMVSVATPSMFLFVSFGWEYEFIRRRLLKELEKNKALQQELEADND